MTLQPPVGVVESHEDVGDRRLEPRDRDRLLGEPAGAVQRPAHDHRARRDLLAVGGLEPTALGDRRRDLDFDLAAGGLLPQERVGLGVGLAQLEEARPRFVGPGRGRPEGEAEGQEQGPPLHASALPASVPAACFFSASFGISIVDRVALEQPFVERLELRATALEQELSFDEGANVASEGCTAAVRSTTSTR